MNHKEPTQSIVRLYIADQGYYQGIVTDMSVNGISVDFALEDCPEIPEGRVIELALSSDRLHSSLRLPAMPLSYKDNQTRRRFVFEIDIEVQMALRALIEGRNDCRVTPNVENRVLVMMRQAGEDCFVQGGLDDVSRTGLSALIRVEDANMLQQDEPTRISFIIPGERTPVQLGGFFRHSEAVDGQVRLGFEFTPGANTDNENDLVRFRWYVESLKDELLSHLRACSSFQGNAA